MLNKAPLLMLGSIPNVRMLVTPSLLMLETSISNVKMLMKTWTGTYATEPCFSLFFPDVGFDP